MTSSSCHTAPVVDEESTLVDGAHAGWDTSELAPVPVGAILQGFVAMLLVAAAGLGATATLIPDSLLNGSEFSWVRYGHGKQLCTGFFYLGLALLVWAWIKLGRDARAGLVDRRGMLIAVGAWTAPMLVAPPLFSHDIHTYLAQGDLALHGFDPYQYGVSVLNDKLSNHVDALWQNTPSPYGPLFILIMKCVVLVTGQSSIVGIISARVVFCTGLLLLCWALPKLAMRLGGSPVIALWLGVANPFVLTYLVGGAHNDLLMVGLLAAGTVLVLDRRHAAGIALVTLAFAVKATACVALPFLALVWAARLPGSARGRLVRAAGFSTAIFIPVFAACTLLAGVRPLGWMAGLSDGNIVVEWLSVPTGFAELSHLIVSQFGDVNLDPFLRFCREAGWLAMTAMVIRQWWLARAGQPTETVRRASIALLIAVLFSPATLPWYFTWPLVMAAGLAWSSTGLVIGCFASVWIMLCTDPTGGTMLFRWGYLAAGTVAAVLAAVSLARPAALRLSRPASELRREVTQTF